MLGRWFRCFQKKRMVPSKKEKNSKKQKDVESSDGHGSKSHPPPSSSSASRRTSVVAPLPSSSSSSFPFSRTVRKSSTSAFHAPPPPLKPLEASEQRPPPSCSSLVTSACSSAFQTPSSAFTAVPQSSKHNYNYTKQPKKHVHFGPVTEHRYYSPKTRTKAQRRALWYSPREIKAMRVEICALILSSATEATANANAAKDSNNQNNNPQQPPTPPLWSKTVSWRGLEKHAHHGAALLSLNKQERRHDFCQAFLYFSNDLGVSDTRALAVFSGTNSQADRRRAVELAASDAMEACRIYHAFLRERSHEAMVAHHYIQQLGGGGGTPSTPKVSPLRERPIPTTNMATANTTATANTRHYHPRPPVVVQKRKVPSSHCM